MSIKRSSLGHLTNHSQGPLDRTWPRKRICVSVVTGLNGPLEGTPNLSTYNTGTLCPLRVKDIAMVSAVCLSACLPLKVNILQSCQTVIHVFHVRDSCSRADSRFAPSQWETPLQSNGVSHWLGANLESALCSVHTYWPYHEHEPYWLGFNHFLIFVMTFSNGLLPDPNVRSTCQDYHSDHNILCTCFIFHVYR